MRIDRNLTADVVIIGGGIVGMSTAYHLTNQSKANVIVLEKELAAQASTGLSVGGIRLQFSHPANIRLSQETLALFGDFKDRFETEIDFRQTGYLFLTQNSKTWQSFLKSAEVQRQYQVPTEILDPSTVKARWPFLLTTDLLGGTYCALDGFADPYAVAMGFARKAKEQGAVILERTPALAIEVVGDRIKAVSIPHGRISTAAVVNTAGPWAAEVGRMAGIQHPVHPVRRQVFVTEPFSLLPENLPLIIDQDQRFYFRREGPALLIGMSDPNEPPGFSLNLDWSFLENISAAALRRAPVLTEAGIRRGWAGLYSVTPDENAIIGGNFHIRGYFCAVGFSGHGFQHGPSVGRILSELILTGKTYFDLSPFAPNRFLKGRASGEKRVV